ncbi:hypothetical protein FDG2_4506 [Candidatus Protofrankia californiensis]|uniref:Uncharacterized protein n=1 Tax=Candidatus Protofrankia californiensis TaxID=1839754 RepID=A0A1C3P6C7_9ACTN|nr:hypothetical protein FDG2_4506 [Candidatus Protofrankia californiensis]
MIFLERAARQGAGREASTNFFNHINSTIKKLAGATWG